jgi:nicotinate-nucleotide adenylyltransferase
MNIGLYGGSFDPVHLGHLLVAQAAREELQLDRIFFIPAAHSPFKPQSHASPAADRLRLLRLALCGYTWAEIDDQEIRRGGVSYSIDTVRDYLTRFPKSTLHYLIGADNVATLPKWRDANELAKLTEFIVIPRPGEQPMELPSPFRGQTLRGFPLAVSSSEIRERVRTGLPIRNLVPTVVEESIKSTGMYVG